MVPQSAIGSRGFPTSGRCAGTRAGLERGLLSALEVVVAELKTLRGDPAGHAWLRRRLEGLGNTARAASLPDERDRKEMPN
jgi:hypothetical protein